MRVVVFYRPESIELGVAGSDAPAGAVPIAEIPGISAHLQLDP